MKTIKVIDLYNKIANGEEVPKKIKVYNEIYVYDTFNKAYWNSNNNNLLSVYNGNIFNYEVKIIEDTSKEDKKIEKLDLSDWWEITSAEDCKPEKLALIFNKNAKAFSSKINEIIKLVKDLKE